MHDTENRVTIIVNGGRVVEAYASDPDLIVEVLDQDTDDPSVYDETREAITEMNLRVAAGELHSVSVD